MSARSLKGQVICKAALSDIGRNPIMNASRLYVLAQIGLLLLALASVATMVYGGYVGTPILPDDVLMFITLSFRAAEHNDHAEK